MEKGYIIIISSTEAEQKYVDKLLERIRNNYVSKNALGQSVIVFSSDQAYDIHTKLQDPEKKFGNYFVVELSDFYGYLPKETWGWLEQRIDGIVTDFDKKETVD